MTGKELKEFAAKVGDDAIIKVRERGYGNFEAKFSIQAVQEYEAKTSEEVAAP